MAVLKFSLGRPSGSTLSTARIAWEAGRIWRRVGLAGVAGLFSCALTGMLFWQTELLIAQRQSLAVDVNAAKSSLATRPVRQDEPDVEGKLKAFYAYLPPHDAIPDQLKQLINVAEKTGVVLAQAEYKPQPESDAGFLRYHITLPVKADFPNVQAFIIGAMQALPTLTLQSVAFKRERIESGEIDARIQFALLVTKQSLPERRQ